MLFIPRSLSIESSLDTIPIVIMIKLSERIAYSCLSVHMGFDEPDSGMFIVRYQCI